MVSETDGRLSRSENFGGAEMLDGEYDIAETHSDTYLRPWLRIAPQETAYITQTIASSSTSGRGGLRLEAGGRETRESCNLPDSQFYISRC